MNEIFRFSITRPPQLKPAHQITPNVAEAYPQGGLSKQAQGWLAMPLPQAKQAAKQYIDTDAFVRSLSQAWPELGQLDEWILARPGKPDVKSLFQATQNIFKVKAGLAEVSNSPLFTTTQLRLADSLLALSLSQPTRKKGQHLLRGLRLLKVIERMATGADDSKAIWAALRAQIVLPRHPTISALKVSPRSPAVVTKTVENTSDALRRHGEISRDLQTLATLAAQLPSSIVSVGASNANQAERFRTVRSFSPADLRFLSAQSQELISKQMPTSQWELRDVRAILEKELIQIESLIPFFSPKTELVPKTIGIARYVGISDLMVVRQIHTRYEPGEISHIENVLPHENFSRQFRRTVSLETFEETETEKIESSERELQTSTRSELRNEIRRNLSERLQFEAGASVTYTGPNIEASVDAGFAYERAIEEANEAAVSFSREVIDRAASSLEERTRDYRSTRRRTDTEDFSTRGIANGSSDAVVGIYRWVDRILGFEVVNYDRRPLMEFILPEPAAYYRYAAKRRAPTGITAVEPKLMMADPDTGLPLEEGGSPLRPDLITELNYVAWVAQYGVSGVTPPPPYYRSASIAAALPEPGAAGTGDGGDSAAKVLETGSLQVPNGYIATNLDFAVAGELDQLNPVPPDRHFYHVKVGAKTIANRGGVDREPPTISSVDNMTGNVPVSIVARGYENLIVNIVLECTRTAEHLAAWKLETYNKILTEYKQQLSEYRDQVASARIQEEVARRTGTHPQTLREIERTEIKRGAVMILTGQNFELFDAIRSEGASGPPTEMSFEDVSKEGEYIQFIEQAFEWHAMSYVFYPYFWGRKAEWGEFAFEDHLDALFARFLRAGSARVVVPIRPGFQAAVEYFLQEGIPWLGGDAPTTFDRSEDDDEIPPYLQIAEELQEQLGVEYRPGEGIISAVQNEQFLSIAEALFEGEWEGRKLRIDGVIYRVRSVNLTEERVFLDKPFESSSGIYSFGIGPRVIGEPWETRFSTTLVALDGEITDFPRVMTDL